MMPYHSKNDLIEILNKLSIQLDKSRGQCFLIDKNFLNFILNLLPIAPETDIVLEIGPGLGTLSDYIIKNSKKSYLIDNDSKIINFLHKYFDKNYSINLLENIGDKELSGFNISNSSHRITLVNSDILNIIFPKVDYIIGNIPYQISAPLIFKIIDEWKFKSVILMVQKEFADRINATVNSNNYSRLSAAAGLYLNIKKIRDVNRNCFYPKPRITSTIIQIFPKTSLNKDADELKYKYEYLEFLRGIFPYKNKNFNNCIKLFLQNEPDLISSFPFIKDFGENKAHKSLLKKKLRSIKPETLFKIVKYCIEGRKNVILS